MSEPTRTHGAVSSCVGNATEGFDGADDCHANVLLRDPEELAELGALAQDRQRRVQPCRLHADAHV